MPNNSQPQARPRSISEPDHPDIIREEMALAMVDELSNLALACRACNSSKGARTPEEWYQTRPEVRS